MNSKHNIIGYLFLSAYLLVLLHGVVPHVHEQVSCQTINTEHIETAHHRRHIGDHVHHDHHGVHQGILHTLGHWFNGFHHLDIGEEHLTHVETSTNNFETSLISKYDKEDRLAVVAVDFLQSSMTWKNRMAYTPPMLERVSCSALSLRGPPVKYS